MVQREADGAQVAINSRADAVAADAKKQAAEHEGEEPPKADPATRAQERGKQQAGFAQPDKVSDEKAKVASAAADTKAAAAIPPATPVGEKSPDPPLAEPGAGPAAEAASAAAAAQEKAAVASATAKALPEPEVPPEVAPPLVAEPLDSTGQRLPLDPSGDLAAGMVATRIAQSVSAPSTGDRCRHQRGAGSGLARRARSGPRPDRRSERIDRRRQRARGEPTRGHRPGRQGAGDLRREGGDGRNRGPRRGGQGGRGPAEQCTDGRRIHKLANDSAGAIPDDEEAAAKSRQQGGQLAQVSGSLSTIDSAVGQTGTRARQLAADADKAKADNSTSGATIEAARAKLDSTDGKLDELDAMNAAAEARVAGLAEAPGEMDAGAAAQHADADAVLAQSLQHEARLHAVQESYHAELGGLPGPPPERGEPVIDSGPPVQRSAAPAVGSAAGHGAAVAGSLGEREHFPSWTVRRPPSRATNSPRRNVLAPLPRRSSVSSRS